MTKDMDAIQPSSNNGKEEREERHRLDPFQRQMVAPRASKASIVSAASSRSYEQYWTDSSAGTGSAPLLESGEKTVGVGIPDDNTNNTATTVPRNVRSSTPGAHRQGPTSSVSDNGSSALISAESAHDPSEQTNSTGDLAVANLVEEGAAPNNLPQADPVPEESLRPPGSDKTQQQDRPKKKIYLLAWALLVAAVVLVGVFAFGNKNKKDKNYAQPTMQPSASPTLSPTSAENLVFSLLPDYTIEAIHQDPQSPQGRAFQWILEDIPHNPLLSDQRILQRFGLATLFYATGGEGWKTNEHWLAHNTSECRWYNRPDFSAKKFVSNLFDGYMTEFFPPEEEPRPAVCDQSASLYRHLWLDLNNLVADGPLPPELYLLTSLVTLSFSFNNLQGPVSTRIGQLTDLEGYSINTLTNGGKIPSQFGLLTKLRGLVLHNNDHVGSMPTELGLLTDLQTFSLGSNARLAGPIPELTRWPKLRWYNINQCDLSGTLPTQIGHMSSLEWIAVGGNQITGTIPSQMGLMPNMLVNSLFGNQLSGTLPTQLGLMTSSTLVTFRGNILSGTIPSQFGRLTNLYHALRLQNNPLLSGTIPTELGLLTNVYALEVSNNQHTGPIPSQLGQMTALGRLSLAGNSLSGTVPETLAALQPSLFWLTLEDNPLLSGTIPETLCNLNSTCEPDNLRTPCPEENHLSYDCTGMFGGCACSNQTIHNQSRY